MKPGKLYIKIALSFVAVLFVTLMVVFALFILSPGKKFTTRVEEFTKSKVLLVKAAVEDKIQSAPARDLTQNEALKNFIVDFSRILGAEIWLQDAAGHTAIKSFAGEIPPMADLLKKRGRVRQYPLLKLYRRRHNAFYAVIPISLPAGQNGALNILFESQSPPDPEHGFALGLGVIGLIMALSIIPISKFVIKPLKGLSRSAMIIAGGDLSHRAVVKGRDEIGELCRSFNHMAEQLEKMIMGTRQLTIYISHELRTPLARINVAEALIREKLETQNQPELVGHLAEIREDIDELDHLIGRILDLSKLDFHATPASVESMDPKTLIEEILARLKPAMAQKELAIETDLNFGLPFRGVKKALYSVFSNLFDNALKFTPAKGRIAVRMGPKEDMLYVGICNTYRALAETDLANIFKPFYRSAENRKKGTGLGLAICKRIIEKHGGTITARNTPRGLLMEILLPCQPKA